MVRNVTIEVLDSIPEEIADIIPHGFNNNIRWNFGHIYLDQYLWIYHKIKDKNPVADALHKWFGFGTKPQEWDTSPPTLTELRRLLIEQSLHIRSSFATRLDEPLTSPTELGMSTIGEVIPRTLYHEGLHVGAIQTMKRTILNTKC